MQNILYRLFETTNAFAIGFFGCYLLRVEFSFTPVVASAICGVVASFIPQTKLFRQQNVMCAIYSGSFAGMSSISSLNSINDFILISIFGGIILTTLENKFLGVGGKLGMSAFVAVASLVLYRGLF